MLLLCYYTKSRGVCTFCFALKNGTDTHLSTTPTSRTLFDSKCQQEKGKMRTVSRYRVTTRACAGYHDRVGIQSYTRIPKSEIRTREVSTQASTQATTCVPYISPSHELPTTTQASHSRTQEKAVDAIDRPAPPQAHPPSTTRFQPSTPSQRHKHLGRFTTPAKASDATRPPYTHTPHPHPHTTLHQASPSLHTRKYPTTPCAYTLRLDPHPRHNPPNPSTNAAQVRAAKG